MAIMVDHDQQLDERECRRRFRTLRLGSRNSRLHPLLHLLGEGTLRAVGVVLQAKVFVDLEQTLAAAPRYRRNCGRRGSLPKSRAAPVSIRAVREARWQSRCNRSRLAAPRDSRHGKITFARISLIRVSPTRALFRGDGEEVSV